MSIESGGEPDPRYDDPAFRLGFARLVTHYWSNDVWLEEDELLVNAGRLAGIPGVLIHGRLDLAAPLRTAWQLARAWPDSRLVVLDRDGHTSRRMFEEVFVATQAFADP